MITRFTRKTTLVGSILLLFTLMPVTAHAAPPGLHLNVTEVWADFENDELVITGEDFSFGPGPTVVTLGEVGALAINYASDTEIRAALPMGGVPDGDYLLTVWRGDGQSQNDEYDLTIGAVGPEGPPGPPVEQHLGTKVGPGLYDVHARVLWDLGWLLEENKDGGGFVNYYSDEDPPHLGGRELIYGQDRNLFYVPLKGYGIPEVQPGAVRKVRLYVNYGHQLDSGGTPTVRIGDVEFHLPRIDGFYGNMAANWSNFRDYDEYEHLGHAVITVYNKNGAWSPCPFGFWCNKPEGTMYRIEAHFYDQFPE